MTVTRVAIVGLVLHLSGHIFNKLDLLPTADDRRRVLAVIAFLYRRKEE